MFLSDHTQASSFQGGGFGEERGKRKICFGCYSLAKHRSQEWIDFTAIEVVGVKRGIMSGSPIWNI
jgi:hypothetical protein